MSRPDYIPSLDGLRGIAALLVVQAHIGLIFPGTAQHLMTMGSEAVGLFFALSGFLMAHLYGSRPVTRENILDFLVSRFARIYPVYLVAVLLVAMLSGMPSLNFVQPIVAARILCAISFFSARAAFSGQFHPKFSSICSSRFCGFAWPARNATAA